MRRPNLFTHNFKFLTHPRKEIRGAALTALWVLFFLVIFDLSVNVLFPYPQDPQATNAGTLNTYFEYGRSLEGKLRRMVGPADASSSSIAQAGWLDPLPPQPTRPEPGKNLLMAVYGQSFAQQTAAAIAKLDPKISIRVLAGPSAPPNYTYAAYSIDRGHQEADVVALGFLASSVKALRTLNGMTWQFEGPAPYSYPRYYLEEGKLRAVWPQVLSLEQLRQALGDPQQWQDYKALLKAKDGFYSPFLFDQNLLDRSAIVRMIRRAVAQRHQSRIGDLVHTKAGFNPDVEVPLLQAMATEFAKTARADGKLPIILIFNDRGYDDHLYQALRPALESAAIPYISTHTLASPKDPKNFVGDGHFTEAANQKFAEATVALINQQLPQRNAKP